MDSTAVEVAADVMLTNRRRNHNHHRRTTVEEEDNNNQNKATENLANRNTANNNNANNNSLHCCRICLDNREPEEFISPCQCSGTLKYVHRQCFLRWVRERSRWGRSHFEAQFKCEICNTVYLNYNGPAPGPENAPNGFFAYLRDSFNLREANRSTVVILLVTIHLYLLYYAALSGPLEVTVHSAEVPDMDILLWEKSDAYVAVCLDRDCRCETEVRNNNNSPRWEHRCEHWRDKSAFLFSRLTFLVFDADIDQNDDFIGEVSISISRVLLGLANGRESRLKWEVPYRGSLLVTIRWTSNVLWLVNRIF